MVYSQFLDAVKGGHVRAVRFDDASKRVYFDLQQQQQQQQQPAAATSGGPHLSRIVDFRPQKSTLQGAACTSMAVPAWSVACHIMHLDNDEHPHAGLW